jgi:hypothetical protein
MRRLLHSVLLGGLLVGSTVNAEQIAVDWRAPASCPDQAEVRARVAELLERKGQSLAEVQVRGQVKSTRDDWTLRLELTLPTQDSVRVLHAADCQSLTTAAVELMSLAFDQRVAEAPESQPSAATGAVETEPAPTVATAEPSAAAAPPTLVRADDETPPRPPPAAAEQPALRSHLGASGGVFAAGFGGPQLSAGLRFGLSSNAIVLDLLVAHHFVRSLQLSAADVTAEYDSQELSLMGCHVWGQRLRAGPCLVASALRTHGRSLGFADGIGRSMLWGTLGVAAMVSYPLSDLFELRLDAGMWVPITQRPLFVVSVEDRETKAGEANRYGGFARLSFGVVL